MNQTAIDNLKALTNLQNHSTSFLSGITLTKNTYNETVRVRLDLQFLFVHHTNFRFVARLEYTEEIHAVGVF